MNPYKEKDTFDFNSMHSLNVLLTEIGIIIN